MEKVRVGFLRRTILDFMAKYIGIDDIGYVVAKVISEAQATEIECKFSSINMKDTYVISINLSKEDENNGLKEVNGRNE